MSQSSLPSLDEVGPEHEHVSGHLRGGVSTEILLVNEVEFAGREEEEELVQETDAPAVSTAGVLEPWVGGACGMMSTMIALTVETNNTNNTIGEG